MSSSWLSRCGNSTWIKTVAVEGFNEGSVGKCYTVEVIVSQWEMTYISEYESDGKNHVQK